MLRRLAMLVLMALALACSRARERMPPEAPRLITDAAAVPGAVGELVTLEGELVAAKQQTVLGVDVDGVHELDGRRVRVTGVLRRTVVEPQPPPANGEWAAMRGPGTYYSVVDRETGALARPVPIE